MSKVKLEYSRWRSTLFPFYSTIEYVFIVLLVVGTIVVGLFVELPRPSWQYAFVGFIGAILISRGSTPARIECSIAESTKISQFLESKGLTPSQGGTVWTWKIPTLFVWPRASVTVRPRGDRILVRGPYVIIKNVHTYLQLQ
jgi:MFS family permease